MLTSPVVILFAILIFFVLFLVLCFVCLMVAGGNALEAKEQEMNFMNELDRSMDEHLWREEK